MSQTASQTEPLRTSLLGNAGWLLLPRGARMAVGLVVGVLVTRHLGPERFGQLSFALAMAGLFAPLGKLGLDGFVVRDLVQEPTHRQQTLATALRLKLLAATAGALACVACIAVLTDAALDPVLACALYSLHHVFRAGEVAEFSLRARSRMRPIGLAQTAGIASAALASIACIASDAQTALFAAPFAIEALVSTALAARADRDSLRGTARGAWRYSAQRATRLLGESWPLLLSSLLSLVALQVDQVMLGVMGAGEDLGHYASAVRLSSLLYVMPMVVAQAAQPAFVAAKQRGEPAYGTHLQGLFTLLVAAAYLLTVPLSLLASWLVVLLYGAEFEAAGAVLAVLAWAGPLVAVAAPRGLWLTNESLARHALLSNVIAATANVGLNLMLIPEYGPLGAAYATVLSYLGSHLFATLLFPGGTRIFAMQLRALTLVDGPRAMAWALASRRAL